MHKSLGTTLDIQQIGNILPVNSELSIEIDIQSEKTRRILLQNKGNAHMIVFYVGRKGNVGHAGCIGCICRPDKTIKLTTLSKSGDWSPNGRDPDFKHCMVEKTNPKNRQGKVR